MSILTLTGLLLRVCSLSVTEKCLGRNLLTGANPFSLHPSFDCRHQLVVRHPGKAILVSGSVWNNKLDMDGAFFSSLNVRVQGIAVCVSNLDYLF